MIPQDFITEWSARAPWAAEAQIEQDLVISRAIVAIFAAGKLGEMLAFRGATALYKVVLGQAFRYSEDIDLVQMKPEPIGPLVDLLRLLLDPWLGEPKRRFRRNSVSLLYRWQSEGEPSLPMRLKVEINTREHFSVYGIEARDYEVLSRWFSGTAIVPTYHIDELMATKLRALYQRKKGRDLFDLWVGLRSGGSNPDCVIAAFHQYIAHEDAHITRAMFEENLHSKLLDPGFVTDIRPLIARDASLPADEMTEAVRSELVSRLQGEPWKGPEGTDDRRR